METGPCSSSANVGSPDQQQAGEPVLLASSSSPPPPPPQAHQQHQQPHGTSAPRGNILHLWADGSILLPSSHAGAGIPHQDHTTGQWFGRAISLGKLAHIQDAELFGFCEALPRAEELLAQHQDLAAVISYITVYVDCAGVEVYGAARFFSSKKCELRGWLASGATEQKVAALQSRGITVVADRVRARTGVDGNEIADKLARFGARKARDHGDVEQVRMFDNLPVGAALGAQQ